MGKTRAPLTILVMDEPLFNSKEVQSLKEKGHDVVYLGNFDQPPSEHEYDVVIGSKCWRIIPTMGKLSTYLDLMLAGVRNIKYPKV